MVQCVPILRFKGTLQDADIFRHFLAHFLMCHLSGDLQMAGVDAVGGTSMRYEAPHEIILEKEEGRPDCDANKPPT